jgi:hypothetical protein
MEKVFPRQASVVSVAEWADAQIDRDGFDSIA